MAQHCSQDPPGKAAPSFGGWSHAGFEAGLLGLLGVGWGPFSARTQEHWVRVSVGPCRRSHGAGKAKFVPSFPNALVLFILPSVTLKCGPPEMGSVHYCCHRSGISGVSSKTSSEWWVSLGASQPHRVPADQSRVWEKFPGCTCVSDTCKRYHGGVSEGWGVGRQGMGRGRCWASSLRFGLLDKLHGSALGPGERHATWLSFDFLMRNEDLPGDSVSG